MSALLWWLIGQLFLAYPFRLSWFVDKRSDLRI